MGANQVAAFRPFRCDDRARASLLPRKVSWGGALPADKATAYEHESMGGGVGTPG